MRNTEFYSTFSDEQACRDHFKSMRDRQGVVCKKCGSQEHYWLKSKKMYQCKSCSFRTSLRSGTLLECSNLPFKAWYEAFQIVSMSKKSISARTLERHLGVHYETAWYLLQKVRVAMGAKNRDLVLEGMIEVDEAQMSVIELSEEENHVGLKKKRGRGANQAKILVMANFRYEIGKNGKVQKQLNKVIMEQIDDYKSETLGEAMTRWIKRSSRIFTDAFRSYGPLKTQFKHLLQQIASGSDAVKILPVSHGVISNLRKNIEGIHHCVSQLHLQNYLDEYCFRFNNRHQPIESILLQSVKFNW